MQTSERVRNKYHRKTTWKQNKHKKGHPAYYPDNA